MLIDFINIGIQGFFLKSYKNNRTKIFCRWFIQKPAVFRVNRNLLPARVCPHNWEVGSNCY